LIINLIDITEHIESHMELIVKISIERQFQFCVKKLTWLVRRFILERRMIKFWRIYVGCGDLGLCNPTIESEIDNYWTILWFFLTSKDPGNVVVIKIGWLKWTDPQSKNNRPYQKLTYSMSNLFLESNSNIFYFTRLRNFKLKTQITLSK
jgi:hypothetical protein